MARPQTLAALVAVALLPGCGGAGPQEGAEQAAMRWAEAWNNEDTARLCQTLSKDRKYRDVRVEGGCRKSMASVLHEQQRAARGHKRTCLLEARLSAGGSDDAACNDEWKVRSPEVGRSRVSHDSARAEVEVRGSNGRVLVLDMSKHGDAWIVDDFDGDWGFTDGNPPCCGPGP